MKTMIMLLFVTMLSGCAHNHLAAYENCQRDLNKCASDKFDMQIAIDEKGSALDQCLERCR